MARLTSAGVASESICSDILFCETSSSSAEDDEHASISKSIASSVLQASYPSCVLRTAKAVDLEEVINGVVIVVIVFAHEATLTDLDD
mmetsp:Transcript_5227/g.8012  ORF Transcript_5227/g.8012 Transcript_5227/m.8012 type:complete len:88 (+) Transcript_5227:3185-3448(+)